MSALPDKPWWKPLRSMGDVSVTHVDLSPRADGQEASALEWLDESERSRTRKFVNSSARRRYVLCRAATRALLCRRLDCANERLEFGESRYGKPFAILDRKPAPISFNVSHSSANGLVAVASEGRVGVDIEERVAPRDLDSLIGYILAPEEQAELALESGAGKVRLFFKLWTIKEALLKALGTGFYLDMAKFEVPLSIREGSAGIFRFPHISDVRWQVEYWGDEDYAAAVAHEIT